MHQVVLLALALAASPPPDTNAPGDEAFLRALQPKIDRLVEELRDGAAVEHVPSRAIRVVHLKNEDGLIVAPIAMVFLSIESFHGGNGHTEYVAAFAQSKHPTAGTRQVSLLGVLPAGGTGIRELHFKEARVEPRDGGFDLVVPTLRYARSDPMCCPTRAAETTFRVAATAGGALTEVVR